MKIYKELFVGLVREYGVEKVQKDKLEATPTTHEQLMSQILSSSPRVIDGEPPILREPTQGTAQTPLGSLKQPQLMKMAKEKGLPTQKTDKKAELIARISENG